jgi:PAS domain S-box-containing protein
MKIKSRLVWKLSAVIISIVILVIVVSGYVSNLICSLYSEESARAVLNFNSESILSGISKLMMSRNNSGVKELIAEMSRGSSVYKDVRLVSHYSGEIAVSRYDEPGQKLDLEDRTCAHCHSGGEPASMGTEAFDQVIENEEGGRYLSVVTPVVHEMNCSVSQCHAGEMPGSILGLLQTDYSLGRVDALMADWKIRIVITVIAAILLSITAMWLMFNRFLEKPIGNLTAGIREFASKNFQFRFKAERNDEIGLLEKSFNTMAASIQSHQSELESARDYLEGIVENSADIIITVNPDGRIQTFNRGAEQALGYGREAVIGRRVEVLFADPRERDAAVRKLNYTDCVTNYETHFLTEGREVRNVLLTLSRLRDPAGRAIGTIGISKDVTREKRLQDKLIQSERFVAIGQAVTGIQHAIKNMLNALKGGAYLVRSGMKNADSDRIEEGWEMVEEGVTRIGNLSRNMLDYAKEWKPRLERVELADLMEKVYSVIRETGGSKGIAVSNAVSGPQNPVECDPKLIHMALMDIATNAIDACTWKDYTTGESPEITLDIYPGEDAGHLVIEVRDNGIGMNEEVKKNVFTPFFSTKERWGTGLGLALTSRIIHAHGGRITLESEPNEGAVFRIFLPVNGVKTDKEAVNVQESAGN